MHPYTWKATLTDGTALTRGDWLESVQILSPVRIPANRLARLELTPQVAGWPVMPSVTLAPGEQLEYGMTCEQDAGPTGNIGPKRYGAVRLGKILAGGGKQITWAFGDGRLVEFPGTYEELIR